MCENLTGQMNDQNSKHLALSFDISGLDDYKFVSLKQNRMAPDMIEKYTSQCKRFSQ